MADSTSRAERARARRRRLWTGLAAALLVTLGMLGSCVLFPRTEPRASNDVLDAILAGMKRVEAHPG